MGQVARKFEVVAGGAGAVWPAHAEHDLLEWQGCPVRPVPGTGQPGGQPLVNPDLWLSVADLIALSQVSKQAVSNALAARRWRGADLIIRQVEIGRGGAGGMAPQVHVDSLPADLREAWYLARGIALHDAVDPATGEVRKQPVAEVANDPSGMSVSPPPAGGWT